MTQADVSSDQLAALDFRLSCCCEAPCCGSHPHRVECGEPATAILTYHQLGFCDGRSPDVQVDQYGNERGPICGPCLNRIVGQVTALVERSRAVASFLGGIPQCPTCGLRVAQVSDVILDVSPLP